MAANHQQIKNYQPAYDSLKRIVQSSAFYRNYLAHRGIGDVKKLATGLVKSSQLRDFVEGLRKANKPSAFIPGLDKALTLIHEAVDRICKSTLPMDYTFKLMSDLPADGHLAPFHIYVEKQGNMLRYRVAHPSRTGAGRIEGQIRVEAPIDLPEPLTLESLTEDIRAQILQITFERGDTVNDDKHLQRLIDILDCASDEDKNCSHLFPLLGYDSQGKAYDSIPRHGHDEPIAIAAAEKEPEVAEEDFIDINSRPANLSKVDLDSIEDGARDSAAAGEIARAGLIPRVPGPGILQQLVAVLTELGSDREILEKRDFQNFKVLTPILKQFLLNIFEQVRQGNIPADSKENIRVLLEEVHALLRVAPKEEAIQDLKLPSFELSAENIIQVREWLQQPYTVVAPEGQEDFVADGFADGGIFHIPAPDRVDPLHGGVVHREGGDPISRVTSGTNNPAPIMPQVHNAAPPAATTVPHALASTTHIAGASSLWHAAKEMDAYLRRKQDNSRRVSLPMMRLMATLRNLETDPVLAGAKVSGKALWESLNPTEPGKFKVSSLVGSQANPQGGILAAAMEDHKRYQQQYTISLAQVGDIYQPQGKAYHFKRTRSDLIQVINIESLTPEELREVTQELIVICQDVFDKIDVNICVYDNAVFEQPRGEELLKQVVMTTMSQGVNLLAADKAEDQDKAIQQKACDLKTKMDIPQSEFQDLETQAQDFMQADTTRWTSPKESVLRQEGIRVMTESGRVLPKIDPSARGEEAELRCEYWSTIANWEKENDWRSIVGATDIFLHVLEPLQTAPELYQKDGIYGHLTLLGESELKTFEEYVEEQRQELDKWATVRQETLRRQRAQQKQSVYRENDEFAGEFPDSNGHRNRARLSDSAEQQSIEQDRGDTASEEDLSEVEEVALSELDEGGNSSVDEGEQVPLLHADTSSQSRLTHRSLQHNKARPALPSVFPPENEVEFHARSRRAQHFQNGQPQHTVRLRAQTVTIVERGISVDELPETLSSSAQSPNRAPPPLSRVSASVSSSSSSSDGRVDVNEEISYQSMLSDPTGITIATQNSIITEREEPEVFAKTIPGFTIGDVLDDGDCFYRAMVKQFERLNTPHLRAVPSGKEAHVFFRKEVEGREHGEWVQDADFDSIAEKLGIIIAVVNIEHHQGGFTCYLGDGDRARNPSELPPVDRRPIIRLAYNGNHYMPVQSHPQLAAGALRAAYNPRSLEASKVSTSRQFLSDHSAQSQAVPLSKHRSAFLSVPSSNQENAQPSTKPSIPVSLRVKH